MTRFNSRLWRHRYLLAGGGVLVAVIWGVWLASGRVGAGAGEDAGVTVSSEAGEADPSRGKNPAGDSGNVQRQAGAPDTEAEELDAQETIQAFEDELSCWRYIRLKRSFDELKNYPEDVAARYLKGRYYPYTGTELEEVIQRDLDFITENETRCQGKEDFENDGSLHELALRAALAGDKTARYCYLDTALMSKAQRVDPDELKRYQDYAPRLLDEGIQSGDWGAVRLNTIRYELHDIAYELGSPNMLPHVQTLSAPDNALTYIYTRLFIMGAGAELDAKAASIVESYERSPKTLRAWMSWPEITRAEEEAKRLFDAYFLESQPYTALPECRPDQGQVP